MTVADPAALVRQYHAAIDRLDFEAIAGFFADDAAYVSDGVGAAIEGRSAIIAAFRKYFAEYPDQVSIDELVETVSTDSARSVWRLTATSTITGQRLERRGEEVVRFDGSGRIVEVVVRDA